MFPPVPDDDNPVPINKEPVSPPLVSTPVSIFIPPDVTPVLLPVDMVISVVVAADGVLIRKMLPS